MTTQQGFGTLTETAKSGDVEAVRQALKDGSGIDECTADGQSALMIAAGAGNREVVRFLLFRGADPKLQTSHGLTALHIVGLQEREEPAVIDLLIDGRADRNVRDNNGMTPLHWMAALGKLHLVGSLLAHHVELDPIQEDGHTPLLLAASQGHARVVRELLASGADIGMSERNGWTALHFVAEDGDQTTLHELLLHPPTRGILERRTRDGWTALMRAGRKGHAEVVRRLIDAGADRTAMHPGGADVLAFAIKSLSIATVREVLANEPVANLKHEPDEAA